MELAQRFLSDNDHHRIDEHIRQAEKNTIGEIVVMVVSTSYHYPMADVVGGAIFAIPLALFLLPYVGGFLWAGLDNVWIFIGLFVILFAIFSNIVKRIYWLKRLFISSSELNAEVKEATEKEFYIQGLYRTREETGILIFISVFERQVWVLADRGINEKLPSETWQDVVDLVVDGIKERRQVDAICQAVDQVGQILETHFPATSNNPDELESVIIGD
jgi:putative membrane protein